MTQHRYLPESDRVSVLVAVILLAFALVRLIALPEYRLEAQWGTRDLVFTLDFDVIAAFLIAGLTATGADWLLRSHPAFRGAAVEHWLLPALTAWALGIPLTSLPVGPVWWAAFALAGALIVLVLLAEYVAIDSSDSRYGIAVAALTALSFALFLILTVALRYTGARLFLQIPVLGIFAALVSLRTMHLRMDGRWEYGWMSGVALLTIQLGAAGHYLPMSPIQYGLMLAGPTYALTALAINTYEGIPQRRAFIEFGFTVVLVGALAFLMG